MAIEKKDGGDRFEHHKKGDKRGTVGKMGGKAKDQGDVPEGYIGSYKFIAEHKVTPDDTLSGLASHHYGNASRKHWMFIYNANKAVIGADPGVLKPGITIKIPELPANF